MRKLALVFAFALLLVAAPARASMFTLSSVNVNLNQGGLSTYWSSLLSAPLTFNLTTVGQTFNANLFTIGTNQSSLNLASLIPHVINVGLNFTAPPPGFSGGTNGITGAGWFFGNFGYVAWNNPVVMAFGTTGVLGVSLSNATFGMPGFAAISATFKLLQADAGVAPPPPTSVPEPTTLFLLMGGLLALALAHRLRPAAQRI